MAIAIYGITLKGESPWTAEQTAAVHCACRETLQSLHPERLPSEEEVAAYWQERVEHPHSGAPYSAYWQFYDDQDEVGALTHYLEKHCRPVGMTILSHFSI